MLTASPPPVRTVTQTLTDASSIAWDLSRGRFASVTLGGNRTLANPTHPAAGDVTLRVTQDGMGSHTLDFGTAYQFPGGIVPVLSTAAGAVDVLRMVSDGTTMYVVSVDKAFDTFSLNGIPGLRLWYKGDDAAGADGDPIDTAPDASTNGDDATQSGSARPIKKTNIVNGHSVIRFNGTTQSLNLANLSAATALESFVVVRLNVSPPVDSLKTGLWSFSESNNTHCPYTDDNIYECFGTSDRQQFTHATPFNQWLVYHVSSVAGVQKAYINNTLIHSGSATFATTATPKLGVSQQGIHFLDGDVAELAVFDAVTSAGNRAIVVAYLRAKYGF